MKHSKKPKNLLEPRHRKFSFFLACFGGGQPSGKKLAFDHSKKSHHHNHRWLLSPYWSKVRLKRSGGTSSKTVPFEFIGGSPLSSVRSSKPLACGKASLAADFEAIVAVETTDQEVNLISKQALKSTNHNMISTSLDEGSSRDKKTKFTKRSNNFYLPVRSNDESLRLSKLDPLIGLSIVLFTLLIMIVWGRLCAILCTSAWFYFVPRFHFKEDLSKSQNEDKNLRLEDDGKILRMKGYKKRIVLEGFLERENRQSLR
ncbi:hypothetical protein QQ045_000231 [Rhodiola kirilowii]